MTVTNHQEKYTEWLTAVGVSLQAHGEKFPGANFLVDLVQLTTTEDARTTQPLTPSDPVHAIIDSAEDEDSDFVFNLIESDDSDSAALSTSTPLKEKSYVHLASLLNVMIGEAIAEFKLGYNVLFRNATNPYLDALEANINDGLALLRALSDHAEAKDLADFLEHRLQAGKFQEVSKFTLAKKNKYKPTVSSPEISKMNGILAGGACVSSESTEGSDTVAESDNSSSLLRFISYISSDDEAKEPDFSVPSAKFAGKSNIAGGKVSPRAKKLLANLRFIINEGLALLETGKPVFFEKAKYNEIKLTLEGQRRAIEAIMTSVPSEEALEEKVKQMTRVLDTDVKNDFDARFKKKGFLFFENKKQQSQHEAWKERLTATKNSFFSQKGADYDLLEPIIEPFEPPVLSDELAQLVKVTEAEEREVSSDDEEIIITPISIASLDRFQSAGITAAQKFVDYERKVSAKDLGQFLLPLLTIVMDHALRVSYEERMKEKPGGFSSSYSACYGSKIAASYPACTVGFLNKVSEGHEFASGGKNKMRHVASISLGKKVSGMLSSFLQTLAKSAKFVELDNSRYINDLGAVPGTTMIARKHVFKSDALTGVAGGSSLSQNLTALIFLTASRYEIEAGEATQVSHKLYNDGNTVISAALSLLRSFGNCYEAGSEEAAQFTDAVKNFENKKSVLDSYSSKSRELIKQVLSPSKASGSDSDSRSRMSESSTGTGPKLRMAVGGLNELVKSALCSHEEVTINYVV